MSPQDLKSFMSDRKLSADDVADICHVSVDTVYGWRIGRRNISRPAIALINNYKKDNENGESGKD